MTTRMQYLIASSLLLASNAASAAAFLAGTGPGCQFNTIQAAINAAAANPGADEVRVRDETWTAQAITMGTQDVTIRGGYANCTDAAPGNGGSVISGQGGSAAAVFRVTGSGVRRFERLTLQRGDNSGNGGAISFDGRGEVRLSNVAILQNTAGNGGGIDFKSDGQPATLVLEADVDIALNQASTDGGGIRVEGSNASLYVDGPNTAIYGNSALDEGGGIMVFNGAKAYISSPGKGTSGAGVISGNSARLGGGVALTADTTNQQRVYFYATHPEQPPRLLNNAASEKGGLVYAKSYFSLSLPSVGVVSYVCLSDSHISGNSADRGSVIYGNNDGEGALTSGFIAVNFFGSQATPCGDPAGAVRCTRGRNGCNRIEGNINRLTNGTLTGGATFEFGSASSTRNFVRIENQVITNNTAGSVIRAAEIDTDFTSAPQIVDNLVSGNTVTGNLIELDFGLPDFQFRNNTIAGNTIGGISVVRMNDGPQTWRYNNNLVFQPGKTVIDPPFAIINSANYNWDYNVHSPPATLPGSLNQTTSDPRFEDAARGNFRLRIGSQLVDRWPATASTGSLDLDRRPRPVALAIKEGSGGALDVGAFERQENDRWLLNGDFATDLNLWTVNAGSGTFWSANDHAGVVGSGSARVDSPILPVGVNRVNALSRCFNVPARGTYRITARGLPIAPSVLVQPDRPILQWRLRSNSADCTGPIEAFADVEFAAGAGWVPLVAPAVINVSSATIADATIEIRLDGIDGNANASVDTAFDEVVITGTGIDLLFRDGFE